MHYGGNIGCGELCGRRRGSNFNLPHNMSLLTTRFAAAIFLHDNHDNDNDDDVCCCCSENNILFPMFVGFTRSLDPFVAMPRCFGRYHAIMRQYSTTTTSTTRSRLIVAAVVVVLIHPSYAQ